MVRRVVAPLVAMAFLSATPVRGQCGIDVVEAGVQEYRALELPEARELLLGAVRINGGASVECSTVNARALAYVAASHWLEHRPDSAARAFQRAVAQAPRYRPDPLEFPPDVTNLFDRVRLATPAVAMTLPDQVEVGPGHQDAVYAHLAASTSHTVVVVLVHPDGRELRKLYRGSVTMGASGTVVTWDGRGPGGRPVDAGLYELEAVSLDSLGTALRKVVATLTVELVEPAPSLAPDPSTVASTAPLAVPQERRSASAWGALAVAGAGLLGGALVVAAPGLADGSGSWARYPVAGSIGLAGLVGFFQRLGGDAAAPDLEGPVIVVPPPRQRVEESLPVLLVRVGSMRRVELGRGATAATTNRTPTRFEG